MTSKVFLLSRESWDPLARFKQLKKKSLSCVCLFVTLWIVACQASLSIEFSRQEYSSRLPFLSPGDLSRPGSNLCLLHCRQILYRLSHLKYDDQSLPAAAAAAAKSLQSCPTLCDPIDSSPLSFFNSSTSPILSSASFLGVSLG